MPGSVYHCMSRIAGGEPLLGAKEKEVFRKMLHKQAAFCGAEILTFAIMSNHFHILAVVKEQEDLPDSELVERVRLLYGDAEARQVQKQLQKEGTGARLRESLLARMGDVSIFLKELKQRFSIWYNNTHERFGTLWAERFKSVLIEDEPYVLARVAAYVDLNAVRAGLCKDPKDYRFCGYAEAVAGDALSRQGLQRVVGKDDWRETQRAYRLLLFGKGYHGSMEQGRIQEGALMKVLDEDGHLSLADILRCRVRYFSDGLALGSEPFIEDLFGRVGERYWSKRKKGAKPLSGCDWEGLCTLSRLRGNAIG